MNMSTENEENTENTENTENEETSCCPNCGFTTGGGTNPDHDD